MDKFSGVSSAYQLSLIDAAEKAQKENQRKADILDTQYKVDLLETLKNTAVLNELVLLVRASNLQQEMLTELVSELIEIAQAKNKEEAGSLYKKAMKRISDVVHDAESITKMASIAGQLYNTVLKLLS